MHERTRELVQASRLAGQACSSAPASERQIVPNAAGAGGAETERPDLDPVVDRYRAVLVRVQETELDWIYRRLPGLDDRSRHAIRQFADCMLANMLDPPLETLEAAPNSGCQEELLDALQQLFQLQNA